MQHQGNLGAYIVVEIMYQHFSETSKAVLKIAGVKARQQELEYIGTEHILLAILDHGVGHGAQMLARFGVTFSVVEKMVHEFTRKSMEESWVLGRLPGTPHFKQVISLALEEAEAFNDRKVGTEYLLLAILREKGCVAEQILKRLAVKLDDARAIVAQLQGRAIPYQTKEKKKKNK